MRGQQPFREFIPWFFGRRIVSTSRQSLGRATIGAWLAVPAGWRGAPHETREIKLTFNLLAKLRPGLPVQDFEVKISPTVSGETVISEGTWWTIRGRVRSPIYVDPPIVDCGKVSDLAQPTPSCRTTIKPLTSLRRITATCNPPKFHIRAGRKSVEGADQFELVVTPEEKLSQGDIHASVDIVPELADGRRLPAKQEQVMGKSSGTYSRPHHS